MDGGMFVCPAVWAHFLPEGIARLRESGAVCRRAWDFLVLTPAGCARLAGERVRARVLLIPGEGAVSGFQAETVVTYGLSPRDSLTLSSLAEPVLCLQRALPLIHGGALEPQEFPLSGVADATALLPCLGARLLWTGSPYLGDFP